MHRSLHIMVALSLLAGTFPARAQLEPSEKLTVFAPYLLKQVNSGPPRERITTVTMSRKISYQDLDLKSDICVTTLVARVRQAAEDICRELADRYHRPVWVPVSEDKDCAKNAAASGMVEVHAVVEAARAS